MNKSDNIDLLSKALVKAQAEMPSVTMDATNPFFKSKYATLGAIIQTSRPVLAKNGLAVSQMVGAYDNGTIGVETILIHESGQYIGSTVAIRVEDKNAAQAAGSAITYLRRYSLAGILGIYSDEDDDGNANVAKPQDKQKPVLSSTKLTVDDAADIIGGDGKRYGDCTIDELEGKKIGITKKYGPNPKDPDISRKLEAVNILISRIK